MSERFEKELRDALRPVDPGDDFTRSVMQRIQAQPARSTQVIARKARPRWLAIGLAASVIAAVGLVFVQEQRERAEGLRARQQLLDALSMTSEKLNIAYRVVNDQRPIEVETNERAGASERSADNDGTLL